MVTSQNYNGWTNYQTWAVALHIDNNPSSYEYRKELAETYKDCYEYANAIEEWIKSENPLADNASLFADLLSKTLKEVNWIEIAKSFLSNAEF